MRWLIQAMLLVHELFLHASTLFQKNPSWTSTFFILEVVLALTVGWLVIPTAVVLLVGVLLFAFFRRRDEGKKRKQLLVFVPLLRLTRSEHAHTLAHTSAHIHTHPHTHSLTHTSTCTHTCAHTNRYSPWWLVIGVLYLFLTCFQLVVLLSVSLGTYLLILPHEDCLCHVSLGSVVMLLVRGCFSYSEYFE